MIGAGRRRAQHHGAGGALLAACRPLPRRQRARVAAVVLIATAGEVLGSLVLQLDAYRRGAP